MTQLPKAYDPREVEPKWYRFWLEHDYFHAEATAPKTPYSIVIPPPNVTGSLHIGHALGFTLQDVLIRWRRMHAYNAMWLPGTDHAGIATQNAVEKNLAKEGKDRHQLGRGAGPGADRRNRGSFWIAGGGGSHRCQAGERRLRGVRCRRAHSHRPGRSAMGAGGGRLRCRRNPAHFDGPRWNPSWF